MVHINMLGSREFILWNRLIAVQETELLKFLPLPQALVGLRLEQKLIVPEKQRSKL